MTTPSVADSLQVSPHALYRALKDLGKLPKVHVLVFHWTDENGKEKSKRYEYSVVRVTDGTTSGAVAYLPLLRIAQKAPGPLTVVLDADGVTLEYSGGRMTLQALGDYPEVPVIDLRIPPTLR